MHDSETDAASTPSSERLAAWALGWPMATALGLIMLIQLATWLPHYLTWPYWPDHDVFANAARAWDLGEKPYRDIPGNNFPGTIYLFYLLGKTFGWARPWTFHALDAFLLISLVGLQIAWSVRSFGRAVPGLVGTLAFLSFYLSLDYSHAAQRDWQAPALALESLLILQAWPGRCGRLAAALLAAAGFSIRPQVVLFLPALLLAVGDEPNGSPGRALQHRLGWLATFAALVALMFLPLALNEIFGDFLQSLRYVAYGSRYNSATPISAARSWLLQSASLRWLVVPAGILIVSARSRLARPWLVALAGASLYKPISPMAHSYLEIPLVLVWSANLAVLAGLIASRLDLPLKFRLVGVLALLGMGTTSLRPEFCVLGPTFRAAATLRSETVPELPPPGYRHGAVPSSAFYAWADYRDVLRYLKSRTDPATKIANALKGVPAVLAMVDRRSALPAESVAWLEMVAPGDELAFVEALERATDSVVLWSPGEVGPDPTFHAERLDEAIRRLYRFEARFGSIEVWRRQTSSPIARPSVPDPVQGAEG